ncbi:hypothetical protein WJX72_000192 [[Myrmecia] bisecta]|uniref:Pali-domain-containing protein n=1 Tax=[Myrmecia] bisecta TaxID=41462 RepID=A0AAW1PAM0_9CHLO
MARTRKAYDVETQPRGCCGSFTRKLLGAFSVILLFLIAGMCAAAIIPGRQKYWLYHSTNVSGSYYQVRTGWWRFETTQLRANGIDHLSLSSLATSAYVLGIIAICVSGVSFLLAAFYILLWLCHRGGKHMAAIALPFSFILGGSMIAYYFVVAVTMYHYTGQPATSNQGGVGSSRILWPDWGWCFVMGSSLLWFWVGAMSLGTPSRKHRTARVGDAYNPHHDVEMAGAAVAAGPRTDSAHNAHASPAKKGWFGRNRDSEVPTAVPEQYVASPAAPAQQELPARSTSGGWFGGRKNKDNVPTGAMTHTNAGYAARDAAAPSAPQDPYVASAADYAAPPGTERLQYSAPPAAAPASSQPKAGGWASKLRGNRNPDVTPNVRPVHLPEV